jgi:hypothetical protein
MVPRILLTSLLWFAGASMAAVFDGQTLTNSLILIGCCVIVMLLWAPLIWKKPRPSVVTRVFAVLMLVANLLLIVWTWSRLPEARAFQEQFDRQQEQEAAP